MFRKTRERKYDRYSYRIGHHHYWPDLLTVAKYVRSIAAKYFSPTLPTSSSNLTFDFIKSKEDSKQASKQGLSIRKAVANILYLSDW